VSVRIVVAGVPAAARGARVALIGDPIQTDQRGATLCEQSDGVRRRR